jgi:hypothetical protein
LDGEDFSFVETLPSAGIEKGISTVELSNADEGSVAA